MYNNSDWEADDSIPYHIPLTVFSIVFGAIFIATLFTTANVFGIICLMAATICLGLIYFLSFRQKPTDNIAFENHQTKVVQNLKKERKAFIKFLEQEREAEDNAAFDKFMKSK